MHGRNLGGGDIKVDYTVLAMAAATLMLLLVFESGRHFIDHKADGNRFAKAVLSTVYRELTTLGSVEAFIFILLRYHKTLSIAHEQVFASVHFTFFYVAIFNTIQTILLAILVRRKTDVIWVQAEDIEISHYVAIRKKFQNVDGKLKSLGLIHDSVSEEVLTLRGIATYIIEMIRYPKLKREHNQLLKQVRFHEMRVHFMESNKLHPKFRVSAYLKECELKVLKNLVDITGTFWMVFMWAVVLLYFICGIIQSTTLDPIAVGTFMGSVFLGICILFNIVAFFFHQKVTHVYYHILHTNEFDIGSSRREGDKQSQNELFWWKKPQLVVKGLQLMQFGYAITFAVLLVWSELLNVDHSAVPFIWYGLTPTVGYLLFLHTCVSILPRFTVCTSLGQLVRKGQLRKILAKFNLEQENLRRDRVIESKLKDGKSHQNEKQSKPDNSPATVITAEPAENNPKPILQSGHQRQHHHHHHHHNSNNHHHNKTLTTKKMEQLNELVKADVNDLPNIDVQATKRDVRRQRRARMRSLSDGVSAMRLFSNTSEAASNVLHETEENPSNPGIVDVPLVKSQSDLPPSTQRPSRPRRQRFKSLSENVALMRDPPTDLIVEIPDKKNDTKQDDHRKNRKNPTALTSLIEDIPVRAVHHSELPVTLGRCEDLQNSLQKLSMGNIEQKVEASKSLRSLSVSSLENSSHDDSPPGSTFSVRSEDGHSAGELPEVMISIESKPRQIGGGFINFIQSKTFQKFSSIIVTLAVAFICAMRVEVLELENQTLVDLNNTWHFNANELFWIEVALLSLFIVVSAAALLISALPFCVTAELETIIAGIADVIITGSCLGILIWADIKRCDEMMKDDKKKDNCPPFGSRYYGGVGNIEPFTFLIFLRAFRFQLGRWLSMLWNKSCVQESSKIEEDQTEAESVPKKEQKHFQHEHGTVIELWTKAVEAYPDIVDKHGKFSGELFQAMLFGPEKVFPDADKKSEKASLIKTPSESDRSETFFDRENKDAIISRSDLSVTSYTSTPKNFGNLDFGAQAIILQGLGGSTGMRMDNSSEVESFRSIEADPKFQENSDLFEFPDCTLVRSMRRCERKFLPFFNEWETVDVVTTRREIILFAVTSLDEQLNRDTTNSQSRHTKAIHSAMAATSGGKGLRLCDVAYGRKVIGSMLISDIDNIKLKVYKSRTERNEDLNASNHSYRSKFSHLRYSKSSAQKMMDMESGRTHNDEILEEEYWRPSNIDANFANRIDRWENIASEERLTFHSTSNNCTLQLRFFVDLANREYHAIHGGTAIRDEGARLWCPTIARLCGANQLKQKCPHLGDGSKEEINDFIEVHDRHRTMGSRMSRVFSSKVDLSSLIN